MFAPEVSEEDADAEEVSVDIEAVIAAQDDAE